MRKLAEIPQFQDRQNIVLQGFDPISAGGFTQVPNFLLKDPKTSANAKVVYSMLLSYAWNNDKVFPGQERLAEEIGSTRSTVNRGIGVERNAWPGLPIVIPIVVWSGLVYLIYHQIREEVRVSDVLQGRFFKSSSVVAL